MVLAATTPFPQAPAPPCNKANGRGSVKAKCDKKFGGGAIGNESRKVRDDRASGLAYADLIDRVIQLRIERHEESRRTSTAELESLIVDQKPLPCYFFASHTKFAASLMSPPPLYFAACG
jgi:hypothetical protein